MTAVAERAVLSRSDVAAWVQLVAAIVLLNVGNLTLDSVAKAAGLSVELVLSVPFILALASLGAAFLFYVRALARLPLAVAYPIMVGVTLLVVALAELLWHGAPLSIPQALGMLMLFGGVALISTANRSTPAPH